VSDTNLPSKIAALSGGNKSRTVQRTRKKSIVLDKSERLSQDESGEKRKERTRDYLRNSLDLKSIKLNRESPPVESSYNFTTKNDDRSASSMKEQEHSPSSFCKKTSLKMSHHSPHYHSPHLPHSPKHHNTA